MKFIGAACAGIARQSGLLRLVIYILTLDTGISGKSDVRRNVVLPRRLRQAHSESKSTMASKNMNEENNQHIEGETRESYLRVQDSASLVVDYKSWTIGWDFLNCLSLNVLLDSIIPVHLLFYFLMCKSYCH